MRVAMYYNNNDLRIEELSIPPISVDELLVKVIASGICGSDVMEWYRTKKAPIVLGHEIAGEIVQVGEMVKKYKKGDRVFVSHHVPCNKCEYCQTGYHTLCKTLRSTNFDPGGFSEYIRVPSINIENGVYLLPTNISFEEGTFIEPLGCVIRGQRLVEPLKNKTVLVIGSGISGLLHIQLARFRSASRIIAIDISEYRLNIAKQFGADITINSNDEIVSADVVIICTNVVKAIEQGFKCVDRAGKILFFAPPKPGTIIPFPLFELWDRQVILASTYAAVDNDIMDAIELISSHKINVLDMITHKLSLEEAGLAFNLVANADRAVKVLIEPHKVKQ